MRSAIWPDYDVLLLRRGRDRARRSAPRAAARNRRAPDRSAAAPAGYSCEFDGRAVAGPCAGGAGGVGAAREIDGADPVTGAGERPRADQSLDRRVGDGRRCRRGCQGRDHHATAEAADRRRQACCGRAGRQRRIAERHGLGRRTAAGERGCGEQG